VGNRGGHTTAKRSSERSLRQLLAARLIVERAAVDGDRPRALAVAEIVAALSTCLIVPLFSPRGLSVIRESPMLSSPIFAGVLNAPAYAGRGTTCPA
ncbi:MAG: hypothetical protein WBP81_30450, partial [Solirubrobacteraceae bacterium]